MSSTEDRSLVADYLASRDERAFLALYRRHTPFLYGMARRLGGGQTDVADDLVEETWLRALGKLHGFRWGSALRTWLCSILINCFRESARVRDRAHASLARIAEPGVPPPQHESKIELEAALAALPDGYREVVVLYHIYGYTHPEIATSLGIAEGTSKSQLSRGLARLRHALGGGATA